MDYQLAQEKGEQIKPNVEVPVSVAQPAPVEIEAPEPTTEANPEISTSEVENIPVKEPSESQEQRHFKNLRSAREKAERERDEALRRLQAYESNTKYTTTPQPASPDDDELLLGNDELAEGKHLRKVDKKIKNLEQQLRDQMQRNALATTEIRLKSEMPDFDKVVSTDNIEMLKESHPELAYTLDSTTDMYVKAKSAYKMIKSMGIYREDSFEKERAKVQFNASKPKPAVSIAPQVGDSPLSRANAFEQGLTDELRTQLMKEMEAARSSGLFVVLLFS
jgi:hypothetical protein